MAAINAQVNKNPENEPETRWVCHAAVAACLVSAGNKAAKKTGLKYRKHNGSGWHNYTRPMGTHWQTQFMESNKLLGNIPA